MSDVRDPADGKDAGSTARFRLSRRNLLVGTTAVAAISSLATAAPAQQSAEGVPPAAAVPSSGRRPNILVIWGDDIGWQNVSAYGMGTMGYTTRTSTASAARASA